MSKDQKAATVVTSIFLCLWVAFVIVFCCICLYFLCQKDKYRDFIKKKWTIKLTLPVEKEPIHIVSFPVYVKTMHENQDYPFSKEFQGIEPVHYPTSFASVRSIQKNRFLSIPAYDHSRVILETSQSGDYINANYIDGYNDTGSFIATQGPLEETIEDFWWMVWEKRIPLIVMLTNLEENDKVQCEQYWPDEENISEQYGPIIVTMQSEAQIQSYQAIRTFKVECENLSEERKVTQYHFTSWPDHGVPKSTKSLLDLIEHIRSMYRPSSGRILVHCGTGVGRTGAFIALYVMLARLTKENTVDIYNYVQYMRKQRISMVSNEIEYIFIHDAIADALRMGMVQGHIQGLELD